MSISCSSYDLSFLSLFLIPALCLWFESNFTTAVCQYVDFFLLSCLGLLQFQIWKILSLYSSNIASSHLLCYLSQELLLNLYLAFSLHHTLLFSGPHL